MIDSLLGGVMDSEGKGEKMSQQLEISEETMKSIKQFCLKTSIPRIIKERRENEENQQVLLR